jgi:hypothetical protein
MILTVFMAPEVGLEPTTLRLTAECSAIELLRNIRAASHRFAAQPLIYNKPRCQGQRLVWQRFAYIQIDPICVRKLRAEAGCNGAEDDLGNLLPVTDSHRRALCWCQQFRNVMKALIRCA